MLYKYEEIDLEMYCLHKSESEDKSPVLGSPPRKRAKLPSAGDIWIPYTREDREKGEICADDLIVQHAKALAREGKRVAQPPTHL